MGTYRCFTARTEHVHALQPRGNSQIDYLNQIQFLRGKP